MEKQLKPVIRFRGFTDPWEQRKVGEVSKRVIVGLATSVTPYYREEGIPILRNLNIKENYLDDTDILFLERSYAESQVSKQIHAGDVLTVHTGYIGTSCVVPEKYDNCLTFTTLITTTDGSILNGEFLAQYLNSEIGMSAVQAVTTQGGRQNLNTNDFVKVEIRYPSLAEQNGICNILRNIDNLITLHQRKYDKLQVIKKAMLEKMFPQNGSNIPEIRFRGFTDPWEQRKLGDFTGKVTEKNTGMSVTETFTNSAEFGVISQLDFFDHAVSKDESISGYTIVCPEDFVYNPRISVTAPVGPINRNRLNRAGVMSPLYTVFRTDGSIDRVYLEHFFKTSGWHSYMQLNGNSGARSDRFSIGDDTFFAMPIPAPSLEEQRQLAGFLESLDNLITLHQRELEKLQKIKKAMLEKMFV